MSESTTVAPGSRLYRTIAGAVDVVTAAPGTLLAAQRNGLNCGHFRTLHVEVIPDPARPGANPAISVYFWSEKAGKFVPLSPTALTIVAQGVNVAHMFTFEVAGRHIVIAATAGVAAGQAVFIATSGYNIDHTL